MASIPGAKVLAVADFNFSEKGLMRLHAMSDLGAELTCVSHTRLYEEGQGCRQFSVAYRIANKLGISLDTQHANSQIRESVRDNDFDLVWIEKGNMINLETLRFIRLRNSETKIAWYSDDNMFFKHNRSRAFVKGLPFYDFVFTTKAQNCRTEELPAMGARRVVFVDKAFDPDQHRPFDLTPAETEKLGCDVGFIGTYERERADSVLFLAENGIRVRIWGNGWEAYPHRHENLTLERRAVVNSSQDLTYSKAISATKINLGFLRKLNQDQHTDRSIEIPACRGFMLAERSDDHQRLFEEGREAEYFASDRELLEKIKHYLSHEEERMRIASAGYRRCVDGDYTHKNRVRFMLSEVLRKEN